MWGSLVAVFARPMVQPCAQRQLWLTSCVVASAEPALLAGTPPSDLAKVSYSASSWHSGKAAPACGCSADLSAVEPLEEISSVGCTLCPVLEWVLHCSKLAEQLLVC